MKIDKILLQFTEIVNSNFSNLLTNVQEEITLTQETLLIEIENKLNQIKAEKGE